MINLSGRHAVIFGVASEESLAWGVAKQLQLAGCRISLGYQHRFKSRVRQLVKSGDVPVAYWERCDVTCPDETAKFFQHLEGPVDILVHSVAYANPDSLGKPFSHLEQQDFISAMTASAYSLVPVSRAAMPLMTRGGSILAMSYLGGHRVVANYKLMGVAKAALEAIVRELAVELGPHGVRVNAISAGPVKTLAASQVPRFDEMMKVYEKVAPMRRTIAQRDVGDMAAFLGSDLARNVTGQTVFVDAGYSILAMAELPS